MESTAFLIAASCSLIISGALMFLTFWGHRAKIDIEKTSIYECGFTPYAQPRSTFDIKFYLVSLLFIVFDVEIIFLFPISIQKYNYSTAEINLILFFIAFIFLGIFYEIKSKVLEF